MNWLVMILTMMAGAVTQSAFAPAAWAGSAKPPILLAVVLYYTLRHPPALALSAAFLGGFLQDAAGIGQMGVSSMCFAAAAWLLGRSREIVLGETVFAAAVIGAGAAAILDLCVLALASREGMLALPVVHIVLRAGGSMLMGAVTTPVVAAVISRADRAVGNLPPGGTTGGLPHEIGEPLRR